jgi:hypothetical protein
LIYNLGRVEKVANENEPDASFGHLEDSTVSCIEHDNFFLENQNWDAHQCINDKAYPLSLVDESFCHIDVAFTYLYTYQCAQSTR